MRKLPLLARLAGYRVAHATGGPRQLPVNLTVSVTYSCPSRCATCDIWQKKVDDLSVDEYGRHLSHAREGARLGHHLRRRPVRPRRPRRDRAPRPHADRAEHRQHPDERRHHRAHLPAPAEDRRTTRVGAQLVLNLSVDEIGEAHDRIRGRRAQLREAAARGGADPRPQEDLRRTSSSACTPSSRSSTSHRIPEIEREARAIFRPDSYIAEVAENRVELKTMDKDITPDPADYRRAVAHLQNAIREQPLDAPRRAPRRVAAPRVLRARRAHPRGEAPGHRLLRRVGERAPRARRARVGLLRARRVDG